MKAKEKAVNILIGVGYGLASLWALYEAYQLFIKIGSFYIVELYFIVFFLINGVCFIALLFHPKKSRNKFIGSWNWIFLMLSFFIAWLGVPEMRTGALYCFGFATLSCAIY